MALNSSVAVSWARLRFLAAGIGVACVSFSAAHATVANAVTPPVVAICAPANDAVFGEGAMITIQVTATDSSDTIASVYYYANRTLLGYSTTLPYEFIWCGAACGTYTLTAVATDGHGVQATSAPVSIRVDELPKVSLTAPDPGPSYFLPATITLKADASSKGSSISKVEFFAGDASVGVSTSAPYHVAWDVPAAGSYRLTAVATDGFGVKATSHLVYITVKAHEPPGVTLKSPANGSSVTAAGSVKLVAEATACSGTIASVQFFEGRTSLGQATAAPYTLAVTGLAVGKYPFTATATDSTGAAATSKPVTIAVKLY